MKIKKLLIYFLISAMLITSASPVFAEEMPPENPGEVMPDGEVPPEGEQQENTGFIEGEGEKTDDIFESIIGSNENEDEKDIGTEEFETSEMPELSKNEALSVSLMQALGVFEKNTDLTAVFTRAQLAHAIYVLKDSNMISTSAIDTFSDIDENTKYANEISVLFDMGYITGYKGEYRPDDNVTMAETAAVLIRALGLEFIVDKKGGWPAGYMTAAAVYGIFDGIKMSADKNITTLEAAVMLKNLLNVELGKEEYTTAGIEGYYMTAVLDIYMVKGIVTDNGITSLDGSESHKGTVKIGNISYNSNSVDLEKYLGKKVKLYYRDITGDDRYVLAVEEDDRQEFIHINSEDVGAFSNRVYTYYEGKREKSARLATDYNIVYNGRLVTDGTKLKNSHFTPDEGYVELIDFDENKEYDLLIIEDYVTFIVEEYNADENVLRSQENKVPAIDFEKADVDIKLMLGSNGSNIQVDYQNIAHNGYVLSVARSLDERAVKIYLAQETVTGFVGSMNMSDKSVIVDAKEYVASRYLSDSVVSGGSYSLNLNQYGHIIYGKRAELTGEKYAYVEKAYLDSDNEKTTLKLYTEDNSYLTAVLSDKALIDKVRYSTAEKSTEALQKALGTVVIFRINANDEIVNVDTYDYNEAGEESDNSLNILYENNTDAGFDGNTLSFGELYQSKYPTEVNTKVFCVKEPYELGKIYCYTLSEFKSKYVSTAETDIGTLVLYNTDRESMVGKVALVKREFFGKSAEYNTNHGAVVTDIKLAVNEDNEQEYILTVQANDKKHEVKLQYDAISFNTSTGTHIMGGSNPYSIDYGDIIRWGTNDENIVEAGNVIVLYDCSEDWFNSSSTWSSRYRYDNRWHRLWIYDKEGDYVMTVNQDVSPVDKYHNGSLAFDKLFRYVDYFVPLNGQPVDIWIYDKADRELREGDMGELITYKDAQLDCTKLIAKYHYGHRLCVIYK